MEQSPLSSQINDSQMSTGLDVRALSEILDAKLDTFKRDLSEDSAQQFNTAVKRARLTPIHSSPRKDVRTNIFTTRTSKTKSRKPYQA